MSTTTIERMVTPAGSVSASALQRAVKAVKVLAKPTRRRRMPTLPGRVRLDWTDDALTVSATDGEAWASYQIRSATCTRPGSAIVTAALLVAVIKTPGALTVESGGENTIRFRADAGRTTLPVYPDAEWPAMPDVPSSTIAAGWGIDPAHIRAVLPAACAEESRPILTAVAFQDGAIIATDSYRLHCIDSGLPHYPGWLIPGRALQWVTGEQEPVTLWATDDDRPVVRITNGTQTWTTKTIEGKRHKNSAGDMVYSPPVYPDWPKLVEQQRSTNRLVIDRAEILRCIRHCMTVQPRVTNDHPIRMAVSASSVRFARTVNDCKLEASASAKLDGQKSTIGFNGRYLRDCILAGSGDTVTLGFSDPIASVLVTDDGPCARLLMPVRLK